MSNSLPSLGLTQQMQSLSTMDEAEEEKKKNNIQDTDCLQVEA